MTSRPGARRRVSARRQAWRCSARGEAWMLFQIPCHRVHANYTSMETTSSLRSFVAPTSHSSQKSLRCVEVLIFLLKLTARTMDTCIQCVYSILPITHRPTGYYVVSGVTTDPADLAIRGGCTAAGLYGGPKLWYIFFAENFSEPFSCGRA